MAARCPLPSLRLWPSTVRTAAQAPRGTAGRGAWRATEKRRVCRRRLALRRPSGLAAWASFWRGVVLGSVPGLLPRRPRRIALRRSLLACARRLALPLGRPYSRERRRARAPSWGRFTRCPSGGAGARERRDAPRCAWPPWDCGRCPGKRHGALPLSPGAATRSSREAARGVSVRRVLFAAKAARCTSIESASRRKRAKMCARDKQKRATALFLRDRPQAFPFGSSFTFPFPLAPLDGHKPAQAR